MIGEFVSFTRLEKNKEYRYGDLNKSPNNEVFYSGSVEAVTGSAGKILLMVSAPQGRLVTIDSEEATIVDTMDFIKAQYSVTRNHYHKDVASLEIEINGDEYKESFHFKYESEIYTIGREMFKDKLKEYTSNEYKGA